MDKGFRLTRVGTGLGSKGNKMKDPRSYKGRVT